MSPWPPSLIQRLDRRDDLYRDLRALRDPDAIAHGRFLIATINTKIRDTAAVIEFEVQLAKNPVKK